VGPELARWASVPGGVGVRPVTLESGREFAAAKGRGLALVKVDVPLIRTVDLTKEAQAMKEQIAVLL
jgi:hypothetical protein